MLCSVSGLLIALLALEWGQVVSGQASLSEGRMSRHGNQELYQKCKTFKKKRMRVLCRSISANPLFENLGPPQPRHGIPGNECINGFSMNSTPKNQKSISPWKYITNTNQLRFPQHITYAKCLCKGCIDVSNDLPQEDLNLVSELLTTKVVVLMRKSMETKFSDCTVENCYINVIDVPIGCHCAFPKFYKK